MAGFGGWNRAGKLGGRRGRRRESRGKVKRKTESAAGIGGGFLAGEAESIKRQMRSGRLSGIS